MQIANQVKQLIRKEMVLEWRSKYALLMAFCYM
jgi:hypothetical protein